MMIIPNFTYSDFETLCLTGITTLFGANLAVFTLTISFLLNKKENLNLTLKEIQDSGISLVLSNRFNSMKEYIAKMRFITSVSAVGIVCSIVSAVTYVVFLFFPPTYWFLIILIPIIISTLSCFVSIVKLLLWYIRH